MMSTPAAVVLVQIKDIAWSKKLSKSPVSRFVQLLDTFNL